MIPSISRNTESTNLENCSREPIHIIGKIQAHGVLIACNPQNFKITQVGNNITEYFGESLETLLDNDLSYLIGKNPVKELRELLISNESSVSLDVVINNINFLMQAHFSGPNLILDFEAYELVDNPFLFQKKLTQILNHFQAAKSVEQLCEAATVITKKIFGYHRVMIYKFDEEWNGKVIAESKEEDMTSWLGLHYPATDIPLQARQLFFKNRVRMITDVNYSAVPIIPEVSPLTGEPLDISKSNLRAVSPIHIEYLKNMEVGASLTAAIIVKGQLWGLIACHHKTANYLDFYKRETCRFLAQMFSTELTLHVSNALHRQAKHSESIRKQLVLQMKNESNVVKALSEGATKFTQLISCCGGAIFRKNHWSTVGITPDKEQLENLRNFTKEQSKDRLSTSNLSAVFPEARAYKEVASGVISLKIAENLYMFWFKPEKIQEINWGGDPKNKAIYNEKEQRLGPRRSFEKWSEKLTGVAEAWQETDQEVLRTLKENISYILLVQQQKEIEALNFKLIEANKDLELFGYALSHDLRAPVNNLKGIFGMLEEDHRQDLNEEGQMLFKMSQDLNERMTELIDNILDYSRLNKINDLEVNFVNTSELLEEVLKFVKAEGSYPQTSVEIQPKLPAMEGDRRLLFQLWGNLVNNALKYSAEKEAPKIVIGTTVARDREVFFIKDNGIGIPFKSRKKIFDVFERAVGGTFTGTGIGLAIVKKVIEKHHGEIWVEGEPGVGSEFYFYIKT